MFEYKAKLIRVVDGDTAWLEVDLGFRTSARLDFRLLGIDAPERLGPNAQPEKAQASKVFLESLITDKQLTISTVKPDKYGRWLVLIRVDGVELSVNDAMIKSGHAVSYP